HGQVEDEWRSEPVILVAFFKHGLQRRKTDRHGADARPVPFLEQRQLHWLALQGESQRHHHDDAWRRIDKEDGLPTVVLGQVAADGGTNGGREGEGERETGQPKRVVRLRQLGQYHGEGHGNQHAAGKSLQTAHDDYRAKIMRERASDREQLKQHLIGQHIASEREHAAHEVGQWDDDNLANQIGGRDPGTVVDARADAAFDIKQRGIGDLDIEDCHEGANHAGEHGDPRREAGLVACCIGGGRCGAPITRNGDVGCGCHGEPSRPWVDTLALQSLRTSVVAALRLATLVSMVVMTDMPGRSTSVGDWAGSRTIFTGMRCTTLVKLPVALSGGSSANSWPLAGDRLSMWPRKRRPGYISTLIVTGCPRWTLANCVSL